MEAIVTFVTTEPDDISRADVDSRIAAGEPVEHVVSKVYRVEFGNEQDFKDWLDRGHDHYALNVEQLTA